MLENANTPSRDDNRGDTCADYLGRAQDACAAGDAVLGMHLYLTAFEKASGCQVEPGTEAIDGLKKAWDLACKLKERSLAEYIFGKLEPFLSSGESAEYAAELQKLALDKLEEFGLSKDDLEDMADMISQDFLGLGSKILKVEHLGDFTPDDIASWARGHASDAPEADDKADGGSHDEPAAKKPSGPARSPRSQATTLSKLAESAGIKPVEHIERLTYDDLAGYDAAVATMRDFGVGMQDDPGFKELVDMLNARHGLDRMPVTDTFLFRSPAREDASRFMEATLGELKLPALRMRMEENLSGMPVLCVMSQVDPALKFDSAHGTFMGSGVLILEDLDLWSAPQADAGDDFEGFVYASLSRGAREAVNLVRSAVDNPDVYVLASASSEGDIDPFFLDLLEPMSFIDIDLPTAEERVEIWMEIARDHPSIRAVRVADLVRYSVNMPRFDIYMAAREAIEEAYKESLFARRYVPVTRDNLFDKLAAYQPLDSKEYHELEEQVVKDFRVDLDHIDDLLSGL